MDRYPNAERQLQTVAWLNAVMNVILTLGKSAFGLLANSQALLADAVHSAADVVGSLVVVIGLRIARKPPDEDHPYGHGKAEIIAASIVAGFLIAAAFDVGYGSVRALIRPTGGPGTVAAYTALVAMVIKEALYQFNYSLGKRFQSKSLIASAYDHRSDVFSSLAALVGIVLSLVGRHWRIHWLLHMDALAGAFVAVLVLKMAVDIARESLQTLMDRVVLEDRDIAPYREEMMRIDGVRRIDELRVRDHGRYVIVDVKICVDAEMSVAKGHDVAKDVKRRLIEKFARVQDVFVHVNPYYTDEQERDRL